MMKLLNKTTNKILVPNLMKAEGFFARNKGLLGRDHLPENEALWIVRCPAIHTFFMKFPIDVVFVDRQMIVRKVIKHVKPWRMTLPLPFAWDVIELPAGFLDSNPIRVGEQLYVDHPFS